MADFNHLQPHRCVRHGARQHLFGRHASFNLIIGLILFIGPCSTHAAAFATPNNGGAFALWETFVNGIATFNKQPSIASSSPSSPSPEDLQRNQLKQQLFEECRAANSQQNRARIEGIMEALAPLSPVKATAESPLLQRKWLLEWTTEKEINFFNDLGISNGKITQTIDGTVLENLIPFQRGGSLGVRGTLSLGEETAIRTNFEFVTAALDLGSWGTFSIPPVGKGWFDTIYLDEELRIDTNSRNDILICTPADEETEDA